MPRWISKELAMALHREQISDYGGAHGLRDAGLLESALARPINIHSYESCDEIARLAAAYAFGISSNHCFVDGNKRTALMVSFLFVEINGHRIVASEITAYETFMRLAAGEMGEEDLAEWFRANIESK